MVKLNPSLGSPQTLNEKSIAEKRDTRDPKILEAARGYEQIFLKQMVNAMRSAVPKSDLVKESMGERIYKDQMYDQYLEKWSNVGGVGLSDIIYDQIIERFGPQQMIQKPQGPLPINSSKTFELENNSKGEEGAMIFNVRPQKNFEALEVLAPWDSQVVGLQSLDGGERAVFLKHSNQMSSTFLFKDHVQNVHKIGDIVEAGAPIGTISGLKGFTWKLET